ncbi:MAG TPA: hypothetical protein VGB63_13830 [Pedobacter sp.]
MKAILQLLVLMVICSCTTLVSAQETSIASLNTPTVTGSRFKSQISDINLDVVPKIPLKTKPIFFSQHLPLKLGLESRTELFEEGQVTYTMPIMKPEKTSKILLKEIDPNFPFSYKMPIMKMGAN